MLKPYEDAVLTLPDLWLTGKYAYVADEIAAMTPAQAAFVAGAIVQDFARRGKHWDANALLEYMQRRADEAA